jgi:hypothetical protein
MTRTPTATSPRNTADACAATAAGCNDPNGDGSPTGIGLIRNPQFAIPTGGDTRIRRPD